MNEILFNGGAITAAISGIGLITYLVLSYVHSTKLKVRFDLEYGEDN